MTRQPIQSTDAPAAIGPYSQAIRAGNTVYLSGQIPLDPKTGQLVDGIDAQAHQVFKNLRAVAAAAGGSLDDIVKLSVLLFDLGDFAKVNEIMSGYFKAPYPARATYQVAALPRGARSQLVLRFFSFYPSHQKALATGSRVRVFGEVRDGHFGLEIVHPQFKVVTADTPVPDRLTPVYPTTAGLSQDTLRKII